MRESWRVVAALLLAIALLAICTQVPLVLAVRVHPALGVLCTVLAACAWTRLVPPSFGYIQGIVSASGLLAIIGVLFGCLVLWLRSAL